MKEITQRLFDLRDEEYARFQAKLTPGVEQQLFIGVRVPVVRKLAKQLSASEEATAFMQELPHQYYDENMLHGLLVNEIRDYEECLECVDAFLPYVDNWAVCDIMSPKILKKDLPRTMELIRTWSASPETYTCRFGLELLMSHFLDDAFRPEYLEIPAAARSEEYYVKMMVAWFFATALAKQWDAAVVYLEQNRLDAWTHNKTIQKARESYRIRAEQKDYLKKLKKVKKVPGTK